MKQLFAIILMGATLAGLSACSNTITGMERDFKATARGIHDLAH